MIELRVLKLDSNRLRRIPPEIGIFNLLPFFLLHFQRPLRLLWVFFMGLKIFFLKGLLPNLESIDFSNNSLKRVPIAVALFIKKVNALNTFSSKGFEEQSKKKVEPEVFHHFIKSNPVHLRFNGFDSGFFNILVIFDIFFDRISL